MSRRRSCQHAGCTNEGAGCFLPGENKAGEYYCGPHAQEHGYCRGCGMFWAGVESFDFGNGLCDNCRYDLDITGYEDEGEEFCGYDESDFVAFASAGGSAQDVLGPS